VVVEPTGRRAAFLQTAAERARDTMGTASARRAALAALAVAALLLAGWAGVRALGPGAAEAGERPVAAASSPPPDPTVDGVASGPSPADTREVPANAEQWKAVLTDLYGRRASGFAAPSTADWGGVYAPDSPLRAADEGYAGELAAAGRALRGFAPVVLRIDDAAVSGEGAVLDVVDRWPPHEVVDGDDPGGPPVRSAAGRPDTAVRLLLVRTADGWRIESAERVD
jgi:hypothetical protein